MELTTRFASGILDKGKALALAAGLADLYEEDYIVMQYDYDDRAEYDVQPAEPGDCPLVTPFVIHRTVRS